APGRRRTAVLHLPLLHTAQHGDRHTLHDHRIDVRVEDGAADPALIRRAVHALGASHGAREPELFALEIARHLVKRSGAMRVDVEVRSRGWERVAIGGRERAGDLTAPASLLRVAVARSDGGAESVFAGLRGLRLLSPGDAEAALLVLELHGQWRYGWTDVPWDTQWQQVRRALTEAYAERGPVAGITLAEALARAVLDAAPAVSEMRTTLLSTRHDEVDTDGFGSAAGAVFGGAETARTLYEVTLARDEVMEIS
ncbi:MAG TPA: hypothetical protein VK928_11325, partial [Longimicrobiales bacterium]|nr:hypothetical protein [Longimicrobiales bacterium]